MKITVLSLIILLFVNGCTLIPCDWKSDLDTVTVAPEDIDLVGTYRPDERTLKRFEGFTKNSKIVLHTDSLYTFEDLPKVTFGGMAYSYKDKTVNGGGKWRSYPSSGTAELLVSVDFGEQSSTEDYDYGTSWSIYKKEGQYAIAIIVSDPDECSAIRFIKENKLLVKTE